MQELSRLHFIQFETEQATEQDKDNVCHVFAIVEEKEKNSPEAFARTLKTKIKAKQTYLLIIVGVETVSCVCLAFVSAS